MRPSQYGRLAGDVVRWNACVGAMIALFRNVITGEPQAVSRTFLDANTRKTGRLFLGPVGGAAIMIDAFDDITGGLHIGEGVESCLAARQLGLRPCWALGSAGAIARFPVLAGIECLTLLAEHDAASARAVEACAVRWHGAGREVLMPFPVTLGNEAEIIIEHEVAHALYSISGQPDRTHQFFYANQFPRVLTDIALPTASPLVKLYQELVADLQSELGILKANKSTADMNTTNSTSETDVNATTAFPIMIEKWITAISQWEGAIPAHHDPGNLKYSTLTASWGAQRGPAASDGGYLCQFDTDNAGEVALGNFLMLGCENELIAFHAPAARTLRGFTVIYAGNPPENYIEGIIAGMGVPGDTQISTFLS